MSPSVGQIILIILVILLIFGAGRLPRLMEDLAKGMKAFKKGMDDNNLTQVKTSHKSVASKKGRMMPVTTQGETSDQKIIVFPEKKTGRITQNNNKTAVNVSARAKNSHNIMNKSDKKSRAYSMAESALKTKPFTASRDDQESASKSTSHANPKNKSTAKRSVSNITGSNTTRVKPSSINKIPIKETASNANDSIITGSKNTGPKVALKKAVVKSKAEKSVPLKKALSKGTAAKREIVNKRVVKKTK